MNAPRPRARAWTWREPDRTTPGVLIHNRKVHVFIPAGDLRRIADVLHDRADDLEEENR